MKARMHLWVAAALLATPIGGCAKLKAITQPEARSGNANFAVYAAMGTSITAGWESGGLVVTHQQQSYAYLFARQAGASSFTIPSVSPPGVPPLLRILSLNPLIITNAGLLPGTWTNFAQPTAYHNMAVPYSLVPDAVDSTNYYNQFPERNEQFDHIVRHRGTILQQVLSLAPTFISIEYGSNEVLGAATSGSGTPLLSPALYGAILRALLNGIGLLAPQTRLALVTVPDVTAIPFFNTFSPITVNANTGAPMPLVGSGGPLQPSDRVLLTAADSLVVGTGFPIGGYNYVNPAAPGNGRPLLDSQVLTALEAVSIQAAVAAFNDSIRAEAAQRGAAIVDLHGLLEEAATTGLSFQGHVYTADFVTGGLFSLDGVHPTDLAHGFIANAMIDAVNATYGASIPRVDLSASATLTASRLSPAGGGKALPWIRNAGSLCPAYPREAMISIVRWPRL
ncbi:MAG: hypothetical protein E6K80_10565 [Candidatus Eisenbacteria bacterium]|uniref:SGNH/GDSL hydrolase family protein n=1 Tax=Eiseniibacteriota bacterium TaxID=2212470 RepID=A0A538U1P6_UNCEI|nr:MAG: hypothetical protein E6K80_10565 [Candidatus Eisenbacteria bacterium]